MKENISNGAVWNAAARAGLVFGLFSSACYAAKQLMTGTGMGFGTTLVNALLWLLEFGGCIYLMMYCMKKLVRDYEGVTNADTFAFGRRTALCSSLILAAVSLLLARTLLREAMENAFDQAMGRVSGMMDSNARSVAESLKDNMPAITFFSQFLNGWIYGIILSAILSRSIPKNDPFASSTPIDEQ